MTAYVFIKIIYCSQCYFYSMPSPSLIAPSANISRVRFAICDAVHHKTWATIKKKNQKKSLLAVFFFPREVTFSWIPLCPSSCFPPVALFAETNFAVNDKWQQALCLCTCIPNTLVNKRHNNLWYHLCMQYIWLFLILSIFLNWLEIKMQPWRPKASEVKGTQCSNVHH